MKRVATVTVLGGANTVQVRLFSKYLDTFMRRDAITLVANLVVDDSSKS